MADHNGGNSNPVLAFIMMLASSAGGLYGALFFLGLILGWTTGNVPIRGSLLNPWETGQYVGGLFNVGGNSGVQTFGDEKYFQNSKRIDGDTKPNQRLMAPNSPPSTILPVRDKTTNDANLVNNTTPAIATYKDSDGNGFITTEEIAAQNEARRR